MSEPTYIEKWSCPGCSAPFVIHGIYDSPVPGQAKYFVDVQCRGCKQVSRVNTYGSNVMNVKLYTPEEWDAYQEAYSKAFEDIL